MLSMAGRQKMWKWQQTGHRYNPPLHALSLVLPLIHSCARSAHLEQMFKGVGGSCMMQHLTR